ncbi:hypothetical protein [Halobaculum marinum]|uniref:Uncharacterized protein n=1 Tax=Halobaculum marinum TaxID=3031996 RepID=A0ABD5X0X3_9EURY|nr:hypothetical protein [Halobaculum sp. DT55]
MVPVSVSGARASPNALFDLDFGDAADVAANSATEPGWVLDRYNPNLSYDPVEFSQESFDGDDRLCIDISEDGPTSGFYAYQGQKYQDADGSYWFAERGAPVLSYDFYIDPEWETDGVPQETGVWPVLGDDDGDINAYPILAYQDSDASSTGEAQFRTYVYELDDDGAFVGADWVNLGLPKKLGIDPEEGGWVTVEARLHPISGKNVDGTGAALKWYVNNKLLYDARNYNYTFEEQVYNSTQFLEIIINSPNFGVDQQYYYDNITLSEPGNARNQ